MDFIYDLINTEFGLLFMITLIVWFGIILYLTYIYKRIVNLEHEIKSLKD